MIKPIKIGCCTLGCKVNQYESQALGEKLTSLGFSIGNAEELCDGYVINTCTVTAESDRKCRQMIRRSHKLNPNAPICVMGCLSQVQSDAVAEMEGVACVCGTANKMAVADYLVKWAEEKNIQPLVDVPNPSDCPFEKMSITAFPRTRAYVKIEDGCENHCTYCLIRKARGAVRSKAPEDILSEVERLVAGGCREVVLTGIETASYGKDGIGCSLIELLEKVDAIPGMCRIRLGSLCPSLITADFVERLKKLQHIAPHFHLAQQSGSNRILALMKRKYNREMALNGITLLRNAIPEVQFTTDMMVGFPGETEEDFADTLDFARRAEYLHIHIFPYSKRAGTEAVNLPCQIPQEEKVRRVKRLEEEQKIISSHHLSTFVGQEKIVLFETFEKGKNTGHTPEFLEVTVMGDTSLHGEERRVKLTCVDGETLIGELV